MAKNTNIEWATHTKNLWWGCTPVSEECEGCYAESISVWRGFKIWGHDAGRRLLNQQIDDVLSWDRAAARAGETRRVFWESMGDIMEDRRDLDAPRALAFDAIARTPHLVHMLLTKRPQNYARLLPSQWIREPRPNVWGGVTVGLQKSMWRAVELLRTPFAIRFVSNEPALGPVDFVNHLLPDGSRLNLLTGWRTELLRSSDRRRGVDHSGEASISIPSELRGLDWIISGGESGRRARPANPQWFRDVRDQCGATSVAWFFKQWGEWGPLVDGASISSMRRMGRKQTGRLLDGREWSQFPSVARTVPAMAGPSSS